MDEPPIEQVLDALASPAAALEPPPEPDPHGFGRAARRAEELRHDLTRLQTARRRLPASRLAFTVACLAPWGTSRRSARRAMAQSWKDVEAAIAATPPGSDARRDLALPLLHEHLRHGSERSLLEVLYRPIARARAQRAALRIGLPTLVALATIMIEAAAGLSTVWSIVLALALYVAGDVVLVGRWLEPLLLRAEEDALDRAIAEAIPSAERIATTVRAWATEEAEEPD